MNISEERWAKMIEEVRQLSEANNAREEETTTVFEIVEESFSERYRWKYKVNDSWRESDRSWHTKRECLLNFILEEGYFKIEGLDD